MRYINRSNGIRDDNVAEITHYLRKGVPVDARPVGIIV